MTVKWAGSYGKMQKENENIYLGMILLLLTALAIIGLRLFDSELELRSIRNSCEVHEDGSAVCQNDTFSWKDN